VKCEEQEIEISNIRRYEGNDIIELPKLPRWEK
jgi:hypothetical protein